MIRKLRIQIVFSISTVSTIFVILFLSSTYLSAKSNMKNSCYSDMSYILSDISAASESTYPIAVVTVNYSGTCTLLLDHLFTTNKEEILSLASDILNCTSSSGELSNNIRYMRKSIGYSNIRIAMVDISAEKQFLSTQLRNYISSGFLAFFSFLILGLAISKWISVPVEKSMIAQKQFIANASHELKTPLTVILSNLGMLDIDNLDSKDKLRMENIKIEASRMRDLIKNMLQIARYDNSLLPVDHTNIDLSYIVQCGVAIYEPLAFDKGLSITSNIQNGIHILGNEQRLQQLISIFLDNALKYCTSGGTISVNLYYLPSKIPQLSVSSQGVPLKKEDLTRIFTCFYRSDSTMSVADGNGLGLSIATQIVEDLGGKIWAESDNSSKQNTFFVRFKKSLFERKIPD